MSIKDLISNKQEALQTIITRYQEICDQIRELDPDYIIDLDVINVDINELYYRLLDDKIELEYMHWSFGEDFSQSWTIPYSILYLTDEEIPAFVAQKHKEWEEQSKIAKEKELVRLKDRIKKLEEN